MPFDKSVWGTPSELQQRVFSKAANGETAGSYYADGRWNLGGWTTYLPEGAHAQSGGARSSSSSSKGRS